MNDFYSQIYDLVRMIPEGRVTTYGAIAKALGVGKIVKTCWNCYEHSHDVLPNVPAHRVVNRIVLLNGNHHFPDRLTTQISRT